MDDINLRKWCFEMARVILRDKGEEVGVGDIIRKAAGIYSFITRGAVAEDKTDG